MKILKQLSKFFIILSIASFFVQSGNSNEPVDIWNIDKTKIEDAEIILVGDSFITANGTTQEHIPSNILSEISLGKRNT